MPEYLSKKLLLESDRHAGKVVPKFRQLLGCPSFTSGLESFSSHLTGKELVHTSYFEHGEVLDLIALNINFESHAKDEHLAEMTEESLLSRWFLDFKAPLANRESQPVFEDNEIDLSREQLTPAKRKAA